MLHSRIKHNHKVVHTCVYDALLLVSSVNYTGRIYVTPL